MENGPLIFILSLVVLLCFLMIYDSIPSKYKKLKENFGGFMNKRLVKFEFEKSPLHTIVHGATGTARLIFVKQYLKLYLDQNQEQNQDQNQNRDQNQDQNQKSMMGQEQERKQMMEHDRRSIKNLLRRWWNMTEGL